VKGNREEIKGAGGKRTAGLTKRQRKGGPGLLREGEFLSIEKKAKPQAKGKRREETMKDLLRWGKPTKLKHDLRRAEAGMLRQWREEKKIGEREGNSKSHRPRQRVI